MTTTTANFTVDQLRPVMGYFKAFNGQIEKTWALDSGLPEIGEQVAIFSRGNWRIGLVSRVTKTGTVSVQYVTPGGVTDAEDAYAFYQARNPEIEADKAAAQARKNREFDQTRADGTYDGYSKFLQYTDPTDGQANIAQDRAKAQTRLAATTLEQDIAEARAKAIADVERDKAKPFNDFVNITTKTDKADKIARLVIR